MDSDINKPPIGTYEVTNELGMVVRLQITSIDDVYPLQRQLAPKGWKPGPIPKGGYGPFPYTTADTFDFSLIGARELTLDGERFLVRDGYFYARRDMPEKTEGKKKMPAQITYSRGAKATDPVEDREADPGAAGVGNGFITLIRFKGKGRIDPVLQRPRVRESPGTA